MTRFVKILQVESVIPHLINCGAIECLLPYFELDREYHLPYYQNDINAPAHSRNIELKENRPRKAS